MNSKIQKITALEILDSRGNPTVRAEVFLEDGSKGSFDVPSGASTGIYEAHELRDGDMARYHGLGVLTAINNIVNIIQPELIGMDATDQIAIDEKLLSLDDSEDKSKLGANSILPVSIANAKAASVNSERKLYNYLNSLLTSYIQKDMVELSLPTPLFNIMNGGAHADNSLSIQEFMVIPVGIKHFKEQLRAGSEINFTLKNILKQRGATTGVGDEGGFAPSLPNDETAIDFIIEAVEKAGYKIDTEIKLGVDIAASQFWETDDKVYAIPNIGGRKVFVDKPSKLIDFYMNLLKKYPLYIIEDPLAENDWEGWVEFAKQPEIKDKLLVGDDLTVTNPKRLQEAIEKKAINAMIIKPNQIGTLTEIFEVINICKKNNIIMIFSHRSGETTDTFIADLAVASGGKFLKDGAPVRGERTAKYNRLLEIEKEAFTDI